ncbi:succinylglutamate desuccinylase/aspartoacylase family protein [Patescibacteria group bacterium]|nr:succinylglutamate desuccinylase/aspartoacylase family protein [Patescibacteria group bacterium]
MELETIIKGNKSGSRLAVFAAIHGNETVGVRAFEKLLPNISIDSGEVHFVIANPLALEVNKREVNMNMNRIFKEDLEKDVPEFKRAKELKAIMDESDAILDVHSFNDPSGEPFLICRPDMYDLAKQLPFRIVSTGWNKTHPGSTDWYMETIGKPGMGAECGSLHRVDEYISLAIQTIYSFLKYFGCINAIPEEYQPEPRKDQDFVMVEEQIYKQNDDFAFSKEFKNFDEPQEGELIATDGDIEYIAKKGQFILFPGTNQPIGGEVFTLGRRVNA